MTAWASNQGNPHFTKLEQRPEGDEGISHAVTWAEGFIGGRSKVLGWMCVYGAMGTARKPGWLEWRQIQNPEWPFQAILRTWLLLQMRWEAIRNQHNKR